MPGIWIGPGLRDGNPVPIADRVRFGFARRLLFPFFSDFCLVSSLHGGWLDVGVFHVKLDLGILPPPNCRALSPTAPRK